MFIIVIIVDINRAIIIIDFWFAPANIIIIGPSATLGRLFIMVRYGSNIFAMYSFHHNILENINPIIVPIIKLIRVS